MSIFRPASKRQAKLRMALIGPSGSGKTYTALLVATHLVPDGRIALIDTERGSASKYADEFAFDVAELDSFHPQRYIEAIHAAEEAGYDVLVIDSLSHAWSGKDGALELVDRAAKRSPSGSSFGAWREVTPLHNALVDAILQSRCHIIAAMRAKMEYTQERDDRGRTVVRKVGLQPIQRDGLEYEFDVVGDLDQEHTLIVSKSRCKQLADAVIPRPGAQVAEVLRAWLADGISAEPAPLSASSPAPATVAAPPTRPTAPATQPAGRRGRPPQTAVPSIPTGADAWPALRDHIIQTHGVEPDEAEAYLLHVEATMHQPLAEMPAATLQAVARTIGRKARDEILTKAASYIRQVAERQAEPTTPEDLGEQVAEDAWPPMAEETT